MGRWVRRGGFVAARRIEGWDGSTGAQGEPLPPGTLAAVAFDTSAARRGTLWLYSPEQGDTIARFSLDDVQQETPGAFPTGRFDPMGTPAVILHGGMVKVLVTLWGGGDGRSNQLGRVYTGWWWEA